MWYYRNKSRNKINPELETSEFIGRKSRRSRAVDFCPFSEMIENEPAARERTPAPELAPESEPTPAPELAPEPEPTPAAAPEPAPEPSAPTVDKKEIKGDDPRRTARLDQAAPDSSDKRKSGTAPVVRTPSGRMSRERPSGRAQKGAVKIGEMLIKYKLINRHQLDEALEAQKATAEHKLLGQVLIELGYLTEIQLTIAIAKLCQIPFIQIEKYNVNDAAIELVPGHVARRLQIIPLDVLGKILTIAMVNPFDYAAVREVGFYTGMTVKRVICIKKELDKTLNLYYPEPEQEEEAPGTDDAQAPAAEEPETAVAAGEEDSADAEGPSIETDLENIFAEAEEKIRTSLVDKKEVDKRKETKPSVSTMQKIETTREPLLTMPSKDGIDLTDDETWEFFRRSPEFKFEKRIEAYLKNRVMEAYEVDDEVFEMISEIIR